MADPTADGLLRDVTAMTRQAAIDGQTLASVFADLRLVLEVEAGDDLPPDVLRTCAVAWSRTHQELDRPRVPGVLDWDDLEDRLWGALAEPDAKPPAWAVLVEDGGRRGGTASIGSLLLPPEDLLRSAAELLALRLDGPAEHVVLLPGADGGPGAVVALVQGDELRAAQVGSWVTDFAPAGSALRASAHRLTDHPEGLLGALRLVARGRGR